MINLTNKQIAKILNQIAEILELSDQEDRFRIISYQRASQSIENFSQDLKLVYQEGGILALEDIPGVGSSIAEKIVELLKTGKLKYLDEIKKQVPASELEFLKIPGIGPKTAIKISKELKATSISDLKKKLQQNKAQNLFKEKTAQNILRGIKILKKQTGRMLITQALPIAESVVCYLRKIPEVGRTDFVGSLRRMKDTIGDIDIVATSSKPEKVIDKFTKMTVVKQVIAKGKSKSTVIDKNGAQIDLEIVPDNEYGSLMQHFTGSKEHNVALRVYAQTVGKSLSEHGIKVGKKQYKFKNETDFYKFLSMSWIPPELREDRGEIEAALKNSLPKLVEKKDIKGDLHVHSNWSDGSLTISEIARTAEELGYQYIAIADHTVGLGVAHGLDEKALIAREKEIKTVQKSHPRVNILSSVEVNIKANGDLDIEDWLLEKLDLVTASVHTSFYQSRPIMTRRLLKAIHHPHVDIIGHPSGRLIGKRDPCEVDWSDVFRAAAKNQTALEVSAFPNRLDLKDSLCQEAKKYGVKFAINTDSHQREHLHLIRFGLAVARRGWLVKEDIINTLDLASLLKWGKRPNFE